MSRKTCSSGHDLRAETVNLGVGDMRGAEDDILGIGQIREMENSFILENTISMERMANKEEATHKIAKTDSNISMVSTGLLKV